jgi:HD superfamily phosphohydrolase
LNKRKIINDPIYGFINITDDLVYDIINHPFFQRLRRIKQLGLTDFVYPGALHTRFHHALGAMHLLRETMDNLRQKEVEITEAEYRGALIAMLLHDVGHAPFSHALEEVLLPGVSHEVISGIIIRALNREFGGALDLSIRIFEDRYPRHFFHQLVSSQLDIDRLDYLNRDSFFTGVREGNIGSDRIIKMLHVVDDELVVEEKGIYSIENFLSARRLMYWQVYLHKTVVGVETMLVQIVKRAKEVDAGDFTSNPSLRYFLHNTVQSEALEKDRALLQEYCYLDDYDVLGAMKIWRNHPDAVLAQLCTMLIERRLFRVLFAEQEEVHQKLMALRQKAAATGDYDEDALKYFFVEGVKSNAAYIGGGQKINVLLKSGEVLDIAVAADLPNIKAMRKIVKKNYLCWPKILNL